MWAGPHILHKQRVYGVSESSSEHGTKRTEKDQGYLSVFTFVRGDGLHAQQFQIQVSVHTCTKVRNSITLGYNINASLIQDLEFLSHLSTMSLKL